MLVLVHCTESARQGVLTVDGVSHQVDLLDLPTVVESYKTYDDTNLVKTGDIGQVCGASKGRYDVDGADRNFMQRLQLLSHLS